MFSGTLQFKKGYCQNVVLMWAQFPDPMLMGIGCKIQYLSNVQLTLATDKRITLDSTDQIIAIMIAKNFP